MRVRFSALPDADSKSRLIGHLRAVEKSLFHGYPYVCIEIRPHHGKFWGKYSFLKNCITLYQYEDQANTRPLSLQRQVSTFIHEYVHHIQANDPNHRRFRGIMHDPQFWEMLAKYTEIAKKEGFL